MAEMIERRRSPRVALESNEAVRLELRNRVRLLDISQSGTLIGCETTLPVGTRGHVRAGLATLPFSAELAVRRHHVKPAPKGMVGLGTVFASMDDRSREHLDRFLKRTKE
jgi:c-di-GMP-binding flagellar brake protein YcgR